ncbi:MAG: hypothetical protein D3925_18280 [Candidatus Electrothrix sp. AR5]|nr:hypothetical protein [Candidatus Electrothrix sp. AR5]
MSRDSLLSSVPRCIEDNKKIRSKEQAGYCWYLVGKNSTMPLSSRRPVGEGSRILVKKNRA